ncbi:patatin-like phospholipase family protein [Jiella endophytica]|nr:patatin-like phospholipase family protein [Jiella endophytica]
MASDAGMGTGGADAADLLECDLIMKGGITSGVVYPGAIARIAQKYRLRDIGGSSAGAIAATLAAAAEYRRQKGGGRSGFEAIETAGRELGKDLKSLFQPSPALRPVFALLEAAIATPHPRFGKIPATLKALGSAFLPTWIGAAILLVAAIWHGLAAGSCWLAFVEALLVLFLTLVALLGQLAWLVFRILPQNDFGLCSGMRTERSGRPAFCEWIADQIDVIAGNVGPDGRPGAPLTIGQLADVEIGVAAMTTDLSSGRPYQLPLWTKTHYFSRGEFEQLFPKRIVEYLCERGGKRPALPDDPRDLPTDLCSLPIGRDFPVLLIARLSLSFPVLIRAVPLWRVDYTLPGERKPMRRCLFSDGGISSNFPIHFFDALLPSRPTFGISLDSFDCERHAHRAESGIGDPDLEEICGRSGIVGDRVDLPGAGRQSDTLPVREFGGLFGFLYRIVNVAKDWQDTLQSRLPGYAERVATIRLVDGVEGGMKLDMEEATIDRLIRFGAEAGTLLSTQFDMTHHRYQRARINLPTLEGALDGFSTAYRKALPDAHGEERSYQWILTEYKPASGAVPPAGWRTDPFARFADDVDAVGYRAHMLREQGEAIRDDYAPVIDAALRLVASADRVPKPVLLGKAPPDPRPIA